MRDVLVGGLASYRISRLLTTDEISEPIRRKIWKKYPPETSLVGYAFTCDWCISMYSAAALLALRGIAPEVSKKVETVLALSAIAGIVSSKMSD